MMKVNDGNGGFDELPKEIIQHIQSFLDRYHRSDAAKTGFLSKSWNDAWSTRPTLDFTWLLRCFEDEHEEALIEGAEIQENDEDEDAEIEDEEDEIEDEAEIGDEDDEAEIGDEDDEAEIEDEDAEAIRIWESVRRTMNRYKQSNLKLEKLVFDIDFGNEETYDFGYEEMHCARYTSFVNELIEDASSLGVNELHLRPLSCIGNKIKFPVDRIFRIRSLTKLSVSHGALKFADNAVINCSRLVSLSLNHVPIDENVIQDILSRCPSIESLNFNTESFNSGAKLSGQVLALLLAKKSLTKLSIGCCEINDGKVLCSHPLSLRLMSRTRMKNGVLQDILLGCPLMKNLDIIPEENVDVSHMNNLESLCVHSSGYYQTKLSFAPTRITDGGLNVPEFYKLCLLLLKRVKVDDEFFAKFSSRFPCVEHLTLYDCIGYEDMRISSRSLKYIRLRLCEEEELEKAEFDVPNIRKFEFTSSHIPVLSFCTVSREWESRVEFSCRDETVGSSFFVGLREFLKELSLSQTTLHLKVDGSKLILAKASPAHSPLLAVEEVVLKFHPQVQSLLCALFCCCHPTILTLSKIEYDTEPYTVAQVLHGLFNRENVNWLSRIHEPVKINVELFRDLKWQIIPLEKFVEDPIVRYKKCIRFRFKWGSERELVNWESINVDTSKT